MEQLSTIAGVAAVTFIVVQTALAALKPSPDLRDRIGPALAVIIAVILAEAYVWATGTATRMDVVSALILGIEGGASAIGVHDVANAAGAPV